MDYGYDLATLISSGFRDERDASRRIIKRLKSISKSIERTNRLEASTKIEMAARIKDARRIIDQITHFIDTSPEGNTPKWVVKFRLMRLVDTMLEVGSHNGADHAGALSSENANNIKAQNAFDKNLSLKKHILAEASHLGEVLRNSKQCAKALQDGVCRRANKSKKDRGYGVRTIQRQIVEILESESAISRNGTATPLRY